MKNETDPDVAVHSTPGVWWLIVGQAKMMYNVWDATVFGQLLIGCSVCLLQAYQDVSAMLDRLGSVFDDIQTQEGGPRLPTLCWSGSALVRHRAGAFSSAGGHPATIVWGYQDTRRRVNAGSASQTLGCRWSGVESGSRTKQTGFCRPALHHANFRCWTIRPVLFGAATFSTTYAEKSTESILCQVTNSLVLNWKIVMSTLYPSPMWAWCIEQITGNLKSLFFTLCAGIIWNGIWIKFI